MTVTLFIVSPEIQKCVLGSDEVVSVLEGRVTREGVLLFWSWLGSMVLQLRWGRWTIDPILSFSFSGHRTDAVSSTTRLSRGGQGCWNKLTPLFLLLVHDLPNGMVRDKG
ncbi:hypothetical protein TanjilG_23237 [Lupinus angustifolius]|uniref:Uncharacterized protein n=1 Tax=Lupinus angustifolius TaxID=3871 RepID=A0A1J7G4T7_LUPAN|nr:hypothetical protein TanjilG_23237 [Lupinus angustifolius]